MRPELQLTLLLLAAGGIDSEWPLLTPPGAAPKRATEVVTVDAGVRRVEHWEKQRPSWVTEERDGFTVEGRSSERDGRLDYEVRTVFVDGGVERMVELAFPADGGSAPRRTLSTALGGNARQIEQQLWRDGGWQTVESFRSSWRHERRPR